MDKYGLIGFPLSHSFSSHYFNEKFKNEGIDAEYLNFPIERIELLSQILTDNPKLRGFNVTIPYKEEVMRFLDEISDEAQKVGAVNVVKVEQRDHKPYLIGYNSDVVGFANSILPHLNSELHKRALVLGTGGAAKSVVYALRELGLETTYVSRQSRTDSFSYAQITPNLLKTYSVIVNCTPCGMYPHTEELPELPYSALSKTHLLYDLVYNPEETMFMKQGKRYGATVKNGLEMLILQANAGWMFWQGEQKEEK